MIKEAESRTRKDGLLLKRPGSQAPVWPFLPYDPGGRP